MRKPASHKPALPDTHLPSLISAPLQVARIFEVRQPAVSLDQATHAFGIREELIRNYMYLLSAPFLAIAIYYLLQIIATQVSQPVLVVMAFVTGLASELIVASILAFADRTLEALPKKKPAQVVDVSGTHLEAIAASREETAATRPIPETAPTGDAQRALTPGGSAATATPASAANWPANTASTLDVADATPDK